MSFGVALTTADLEYELPTELIAQRPAAHRGGSRLMVLDAGVATPRTIGRFDECFLDQLRPDDLVVANDSRVLNARLRLQRASGGAGEVLLLAPESQQSADLQRCRWSAMARPARKFRPGDVVELRESDVAIEFVERTSTQTWTVELPCSLDEVPEWLRAHGELPLPPYITERAVGDERYQTVHARWDGSVAAPTAGLHFDDASWAAVRDRVADIAHVTLHVGAGTFLPVAEGELADHVMHHERYEVSTATDAAVRAAIKEGCRVVAIGTTTTRVLETVYAQDTPELHGSTDLFITPGHRWNCVGAMLTNFHLPASTLIALVMAFHGIEQTRATYERAIAEQMRFYSFGDAMFLHGPPVAHG